MPNMPRSHSRARRLRGWWSRTSYNVARLQRDIRRGTSTSNVGAIATGVFRDGGNSFHSFGVFDDLDTAADRRFYGRRGRTFCTSWRATTVRRGGSTSSAIASGTWRAAAVFSSAPISPCSLPGACRSKSAPRRHAPMTSRNGSRTTTRLATARTTTSTARWIATSSTSPCGRRTRSIAI